MFFPGVAGVFMNPFYFARAGLCSAMKDFAPELSGALLDVGCGSKPYRTLFSVETYTGLDLDSEHTRQLGVADQYYDGGQFPFADDTFDAVLCNQVLEHIFEPKEFLREILRVLKPGGRLLLTVPFVWDEHEQPADYSRYSSFGLEALLSGAGFRILKQKKLCADAAAIFQMLNAYLHKITMRWPRAFQILFTVTFISFFNIMGLLARFLLPANQDFYLDNVVLAENGP
jgi:SAM-dependent methyltransferase